MYPQKTLTLFFLVLPSIILCQNFRGAIRNLEKKDYDKTERVILKALEKDSLDPGAYYVNARLYAEPDFINFNLDTAHAMAIKALKNYKSLDEKEKDKLARVPITDSLITLLKEGIELEAFEVAARLHSEKSYNTFLMQFPEAVQVPEARIRRNKLAFEAAEKANNHEAYRVFFERYPEADQSEEAMKRYHHLLFEEKTKADDLGSYRLFLTEHPNSTFRREAEEKIFKLMSQVHKIEGYRDFIEAYPNSHYAKQAINFLYHLYKDKRSIESFVHQHQRWINDSLLQVINAEKGFLLPFTEKGDFGFINQRGQVVIHPKLNSLTGDQLCKPVTTDYVKTVKDGKDILINRTGNVIYEGRIDSLKDLGSGFLRISARGLKGVVHKSGKIIFPSKHSAIELLDSALFEIKTLRTWGIFSWWGKELVPQEYDDIRMLGNFILLERENRIGITIMQDVIKGKPLKKDFAFDDVEVLGEEYLLVFKDDKEGLLNEQLEFLIPPDDHRIYDLRDKWAIRENQGYRLFNRNMTPITTNGLFEKIDFNHQWLSVKQNGNWALLNQDSLFIPFFKYDSVRLLSNDVAIIWEGENFFANFSSGVKLPLNEVKRYQIIKPLSVAADHPDYVEHFLTVNNKDIKRLYNAEGKKILAGRFDEVSVINDNLFIIDNKNKKGLSDSSGQNVLPIENDAIGDYFQEHVSFLRGQKFGLFIYPTRDIIPPEYDKPLKIYAPGVYLAVKKQQHGLVDRKNDPILDFEYDEIKYWTDSTAFVHSNNHWNLLNIYDNTSVIDSIEYVQWLHHEGKATTAVYSKKNKQGVINNKNGEILSNTFDHITALGTAENPVYQSEKYIHEADFHVVVYYNPEGEVIHKQALSDEEYELISCIEEGP